MTDLKKAIEAAEAAQARALEWLRTHQKTHSARKLDVKSLVGAIDALLDSVQRLVASSECDVKPVTNNDASTNPDEEWAHKTTLPVRNGVKALTGSSDAELDELGGFSDEAPDEEWEYGWRAFFNNGEEHEWLACSSRDEAEREARVCQEAEDRAGFSPHTKLTYSVWRRRVVAPGPWEEVPSE